jgi:hypothetical protein
VLSIILEEMKEGATKEEVLIEQDVHLVEQTRAISTKVHG